MTSRNRETLRNYFGNGKLPSDKHFGDLIDSMLNMTDEGFRKSPQNGFEVATPVGYDTLISFFRDRNPNTRKGSISFSGRGEDREQILFQVGEDEPYEEDEVRLPVLVLDAHRKNAAVLGDDTPLVQRVGINQAEPRSTLDVGGVVRAEGRMGSMQPEHADQLLADGKWQDISPPLKGCQAFEVMAGVGLPDSGRYSLLHAIALNTFNPADRPLQVLWNLFWPRKQIRATQAYYSRRCDQLELRWHGGSGRDGEYRLQIRTRCQYADDVGQSARIQCQLTSLWFDPLMSGSSNTDNGGGATTGKKVQKAAP
jgi:hypothetical protein